MAVKKLESLVIVVWCASCVSGNKSEGKAPIKVGAERGARRRSCEREKEEEGCGRRKCVERGKAEYEIASWSVRKVRSVFLFLSLSFFILFRSSESTKKVQDVRDQYGVTVGGQ